MFVELKVLGEPYGGRRVVAPFGQTLKVGRLERDNQLTVPDRLLAPTHFELAWDGVAYRANDLSRGVKKHPACQSGCFQEALRNEACRGICRVYDRSSENGLYLNGQKIDSAVVKDGDVLVAGASCFTVSLAGARAEAPAVPPPPAAPLALTPEQQTRALDFFAQQRLPLYAVLDAARDPAVLDALAVNEAVYYSLYDGPEGEKLEAVAPYLVEVRGRSPLLETLVRVHWGKRFGVFAYALADFKTVRRQFRRFLLVEDEQGKRMHFRFYDPRVLRSFLPVLDASETRDFFGPISHFIVESDDAGAAWGYQFDSGGRLVISRAPF